MEEIKINSIQDFLGLENIFLQDCNEIWYRGQSNAEWNLTPSIFRDSVIREYTQHKEDSISAIFKQNASMLISAPHNEIDWMFIMQHHGIPTRLLDWSENPLVALFFTLDDKNSNLDGCLWLLKPKILNRTAISVPTIPLYSDDLLNDYMKHQSTYEKKPAALLAVRNNSRIQIQEGVFTIHNHNAQDIEYDDTYLLKIIIPKESKEHIKKQLTMLGINEFRLFPELSNIKTIIKHKGLLV